MCPFQQMYQILAALREAVFAIQRGVENMQNAEEQRDPRARQQPAAQPAPGNA